MDLPTDSLYKFLALSGLWIAGFATWFWWTRRREFLKAQTKLEIEHAALQRENDYLLQRQARSLRRSAAFTENLGHIRERVTDLRSIPVEHRTEALNRLIAETDEELAAAEARDFEAGEALEREVSDLNEAGMKLAAMDLTARRQKSEGEELAWLQRVTGYVVLGGVVLALAGFLTWYIKVQRFQDDATVFALREQKAKTISAELELDAKRKLGAGSPAATRAAQRSAAAAAGTKPLSGAELASRPPSSAIPSSSAKTVLSPSAPSVSP